VIHPGVDLAPYRDLAALRRERARVRAELGIEDGTIVMGTVGRFAPQKNVRMLLPLIREIPGVRWLLVGDGSERPEITEEVARLRASERVLMPGLRTDVPACLAALDLFLLVSLWEGLPLALLEAGAAAVPIVAADVGGSREILPPAPAGWSFPPGDAAALRDAAESCLGQLPAAREAALRHRELVLAEASVERMLERTFSLYRLDANPLLDSPGPA
jgi:glycosyltransferase involved in cell wall biosynthesis